MTRLALSVIIAVGVIAPAAQAKVHSVIPPGNSGIGQYVESIPTASGNRPTNSVAVSGGGQSGGSQGGGGQSGGSQGGGSQSGGGQSSGQSSGGQTSGQSTGGQTSGQSSGGQTAAGAGGPITGPTQRKLDGQGVAGRAAAALARATAPRISHRAQASGPGASARIKPSGAAGGGRTTGELAPTGAGTSAVGSVADAITGSTSNGGLGTVLPVILLVTLVGSATMALLRRRHKT